MFMTQKRHSFNGPQNVNWYLWWYFICWYDIMFRSQNWEDNEHRKTKPVKASVCPTTLLETGKKDLWTEAAHGVTGKQGTEFLGFVYLAKFD